MNICVIGGAGYIGSHAVKLLVEKGHAVTCVDNLTNGHRAAAEIALSGGGAGRGRFYVADLANTGQIIDPGKGNFTIRFLAGAGGDSIVPHTGGVDQVVNFDIGTDVLDLRSLLSENNVNPNAIVATPGDWLTVSSQGADAFLSFDPTGHGGGSTVAVLQDLAGEISGLSALIAHGAVRIA